MDCANPILSVSCKSPIHCGKLRLCMLPRTCIVLWRFTSHRAFVNNDREAEVWAEWCNLYSCYRGLTSRRCKLHHLRCYLDVRRIQMCCKSYARQYISICELQDRAWMGDLDKCWIIKLLKAEETICLYAKEWPLFGRGSIRESRPPDWKMV